MRLIAALAFLLLIETTGLLAGQAKPAEVIGKVAVSAKGSDVLLPDGSTRPRAPER